MHFHDLYAIGLLSLICLTLPWVSVLLRAWHSKGENRHFVSTTSLCLQQLVVQIELVTLLVAYKFDPAVRAHSVTNIVLVVSQWCCLAALLLMTILRQGSKEPTARRCGTFIDSLALLPAIHAVATVVLLNWTIYNEDAVLARAEAFHELNSVVLSPMATMILVVAFILQARRASRACSEEDEQAVSNERFVLGYEAICYAALAALWSISIGLPLSWTWYGLGGWACVNNTVRALGSALSASLLAGRRKQPRWLQARWSVYTQDSLEFGTTEKV